MQRVYSTRQVFALRILVSALTACSVQSGGSGPEEHSTPPSSSSTTGHAASGAATPASGERNAAATAVGAAEGAADEAESPGAASEAAADGVADEAAEVPSAADTSAEPATPAELPAADAAPAASFSLISGLVTDGGSGSPGSGLGGLGTLASATTVQVSALVNGVLQSVGVAAVVDGRYEVKVPLGLENLVAQVLDSTGNVLGAVLVGSSGERAKSVVVADPVTSETSLESLIMLHASGCPAMTSVMQPPTLSLELSALVDPQLTAALTAAVSAGVDVDALLEALSDAVLASARVQTRALAELSADASPNVQVRARVAANLAFVSALSDALAGVENAEGVVFAALHSAAQLEVQLTTEVVKSTLEVAGASQELVDAVVSAGDRLLAAVAAATNISALKQARLDYLSTLLGSITGGDKPSGGLLGALLTQTTGAVNSLLGSVLDDTEKLSATLRSTLTATVSAVSNVNVCVDVAAPGDIDAALAPVLEALEKFVTDVQALAPSLVQGDGDGDAAAAALVTDLLATTELLLQGLLQ